MLQSANKRLTNSTQVALVCASLVKSIAQQTSIDFFSGDWGWCLDPPATVAHELQCPALAEDSDVCLGHGFMLSSLETYNSRNLESIGPQVFPIAAIHMTISLSVAE